MLPLSPIIFHTTDSMLDRPSRVTAADNNKKEKRKKKKRAHFVSMIETTCVSKSVQFCSRGNVFRAWASHKINWNGGKKLQINGVSLDTDGGGGRKSVFIVNAVNEMRFVRLIPSSSTLPLQMDANSLLITSRIETIVGPVFSIPSISIRIHYLGRRGREGELSVKRHLFCRVDVAIIYLYVAEFRDSNR